MVDISHSGRNLYVHMYSFFCMPIRGISRSPPHLGVRYLLGTTLLEWGASLFILSHSESLFINVRGIIYDILTAQRDIAKPPANEAGRCHN